MANYYKRVYRVVDNVTGEILDENTVVFTVKKIKPREFIKVYIDVLDIFARKFSDGEKALLLNLVLYTEYDTGKIHLDVEVKKKIAEVMDTNINSINVLLGRLVAKKAIFRKSRGVYYLNPIYLWKGSEGSNEKALRVTIEDISDEVNDLGKEG